MCIVFNLKIIVHVMYIILKFKNIHHQGYFIFIQLFYLMGVFHGGGGRLIGNYGFLSVESNVDRVG